MKKYYRVYNRNRKQKKYNEFKRSNVNLFTEVQLEKIKRRILKVKAISILTYGDHNAKRLSTYPNIYNGITSKGICAYCDYNGDVIHFDDDVSLCENCASENNLI